MIKIELNNFDSVRKAFEDLGNQMEAKQVEALQKIGLYGETLAKKTISTQSMNWTPLRAKYLAYKIKKGFSEKILVKSSSLFQSISSWVDKTKMVVHIGIPINAKNSKGQPIHKYAKVLEYGSPSKNIPPRPLWRMVMEATRNEINRIAKKALN
jgi:phage gpG-like protein